MNTGMPGGQGPDWSPEATEAAARRIVDPSAMAALLEESAAAGPDAIRDILYEAGRSRGLQASHVAALLQVTDPDLRRRTLAVAHTVHERSFGRRVRLLCPVCPTNRCINDCRYCPLRRSNTRLKRRADTARDLQREVVALLDEGYRHVTLVFGEDRSGIVYVCDMVQAAYGARSGSRQVRRVDVNVNASRSEDIAALAGIDRLGTYHLFQETYHPGRYAELHQSGPKSGYAWRLTAHDRACQGGVRDSGLGVLLGAYDFRFDVLAVLQHARYLMETYDTGAQCISYPRMIPVPGSPASSDEHWQVSDEDLVFVVAVTRLAAPCTEIVLSTPAPAEVRRQLYSLGVTQVSVGSQSYPGVYSGDGDPGAAGTLTIGRPRNLEHLVYRMVELGIVPDFCVDCYAQLRQMLREAAANVQRCPVESCAPNSLLALKEYLMDYASPETQAIGEGLIQAELARLPQRTRSQALDLMEEAEAGFRGQML